MKGRDKEDRFVPHSINANNLPLLENECKMLESTGAYNNPVFSSIVVVLPELLSNGNNDRMSETGREIKG